MKKGLKGQLPFLTLERGRFKKSFGIPGEDKGHP